MATNLVGASVWEEQLYEHLTSHEQQERGLLVEYQEAAASSRSPAFQYLVSLIVEDEKRHHRVFQDLASALRADVELRPEQPAIPRLDLWGSEAAHIIELTEQLLERERTDARELHRLARELKDVKDTTMWQLLVKLIEMDTAKHVEILEFIEHHAKKPPW
jgi:rubrerythrin